MEAMNESFLQQLASHLIDQYKGQMDEVVLILPSRRARIFLIEAFKQKSEGAGWLPVIRSMEDFIGEISDINTADQLDLLFEFYEVYKNIEGKKAESLEDFMAWANLLLHDFNEIDRNLIDAKELFSFLNASKALDSWTPEGEDLSDYQKKYLNFWEKFHGYYDQLNQHLAKKHLAYQGKMYKEAIGKIAEEGDQLLRLKYYCFAGFNALTPAESELIKTIESHRKVEMLWDADEYYMKDANQEAGIFLRKRAEASSAFNWLGKELSTAKKEIRIYGVPGDIGQAKLLAELLDKETELHKQSDPMQRAIILSDENLLIPVLESLPEHITPLNITMGYPVNQSAFYTLFHNYINLFRGTKKEEIKKSFYHKDLFAFLEDPFLKTLSPDIENTLAILKEPSNLYYPLSSIQLALPEKLRFLISDDQQILSKVQALLLLLKESNELSDLELEVLFHFYKLFNRLADLNKINLLSTDALMSIYRQFISKSQLSFVGEPLNGLQLMGVLESRTLDFKEIYLCSLNEGILPSGKSQNSLIPFEIKKKFNLPTHREKDAIFAYHFYRILQRAEKVHLIYNSSIEGLKGAERSRFIEQLLHEMPQKNPNISISEIKVSSIQSTKELEAERIEKSEELIAAIHEKLQSGLSPSSINTYLQCPLDFYYKYILGLREENSSDPEEGIENSLFGTLLHDCLEQLYKDYSGELLQKEHFQKIEKESKTVLEQVFLKNKIKKWDEGQMRLVFEVCLSYLKKFFDWEIKRTAEGPIHIIELETEHLWEGSIELTNGKNIPVKLKGKIDRIEEHNGFKQIIDYKSGKVENAQLNAKNVDQILESKDNKFGKQVQLLIYQLLCEKLGGEYKAGIISFRSLDRGIWGMKELAEGDIHELLAKVISEMLDKKIPFEHNTDSKYCKFCRDL